MIIMSFNRLLIVSPHPDDETLGAGGTILKHKAMDNQIFWLNITNMKEEYGFSKETVEKRNKEIALVKELYRFDGLYNLELEPAGLEKYSSSDIICRISSIINDIKPNVVVLPFKNDVHTDHQRVYDWVYSCTKVFRHPYIKKILAMEVLSETDFCSPENGFIPNYFSDISNYLDKKIEIMKVYESEIGVHPFPRSLENIVSLATNRGATCGVRYAEAFRLIKEIE